VTEDWATELQRGEPDRAWDLFLTRYRRLILAAIRHYTQDYDDVMDVFARACEALRADNFRRLRTYLERQDHQARFSTWLVTVIRHLAVDWFRERDGRRRLPAIAEGLPPLQRRIFEHVFLGRRSHVETYELVRVSDGSALSFGEFLTELRQTYRAVMNGRRGSALRELGGPFPPDCDPDDAAPLGSGDVRDLLDRVMGTLSAEDRVAVQLFVIDELPAKDVARIVGAPNAKAVYNRVYRALAAAREELERAGIRREDVL
jgi:DNA-directed RNA polymerase specialized sigma24 family protein